jgi:hypothetical protein
VFDHWVAQHDGFDGEFEIPGALGVEEECGDDCVAACAFAFDEDVGLVDCDGFVDLGV